MKELLELEKTRAVLLISRNDIEVSLKTAEELYAKNLEIDANVEENLNLLNYIRGLKVRIDQDIDKINKAIDERAKKLGASKNKDENVQNLEK